MPKWIFQKISRDEQGVRHQPFEPSPVVSEMNPWTNDMAENGLITLQCTGT